ncbi:MAG: M12 family metallo-peptidase [Phycisphaerales bacterium]|nr:M12 family metallo-peptidase [Phycisphaerales bacterium]
MLDCSSSFIAPTFAVATLAMASGTALGSNVTIKQACEALSLESCTIQSLQLRDAAGGDSTLELVLSGQDRTLRVWEHDVRGPDYRLLVQEEDGTLTEDPPGPVSTYRGTDLADPDVRLALGMEENGFLLRLIEGDGRQWFAEPLLGRVPGAEPGEYAVYEGEAIISPENECPIDDAWRIRDGHGTTRSSGNASSGSILAAEMAVDADYEFFGIYGSVSGVENRVNAVINSVNVQYESQCQLTHELQAIVVRSTSSDPYSGDIESRLDQLQAEWNGGNHPGIARDMVHLFTGGNMGSTIGLAYLGAVCSSSEYGVVESSCCGSFGCSTDLSAHEMGHNWNAGHCSCPSNTMNPSLVCANDFTSGSINSITSFANSISGCLHVAGPSGACCLGSNCQILALSECQNLGGEYQGDGTDCSQVECTSGTGACCLSSGSCATVAESQCANVGGEYQGDNVPCNDELCLPDPVGACCYGESCNVTEEADCSGSWLGAETDCIGTPCTDNNFSGVAWKVVGTNLADTTEDTWTVDMYAMLGDGERIDAVAGNSLQQKTVTSTEGFWQNAYGGPTSQEVNPAFYDLVPDLVYDSRVTIGALDSSGDPFGSNELNNIGIDFTNFENGGSISADNGTWFVLPTDPQGAAQPVVTDDCQVGYGVLIGRLTAYGHSSEVMVEALFQGRNAVDITWQATGGTTATLGNWADCNANGTNDACDISGGTSEDANGNGIPDECESSCAWDLNGDGATTVDDLLALIGAFGTTYDVDDLLGLLAEFGCQ